MDNLFEQMANITKAHGYDILCEQVKELKAENEKLRARVKAFEGIVKRCVFMFGNEANYPEGTIGYQLAQDARALLNK